MMLCNLFIGKLQKSGSVVVENVTLLFKSQKICRFNRFNCCFQFI